MCWPARFWPTGLSRDGRSSIEQALNEVRSVNALGFTGTLPESKQAFIAIIWLRTFLETLSDHEIQDAITIWESAEELVTTPCLQTLDKIVAMLPVLEPTKDKKVLTAPSEQPAHDLSPPDSPDGPAGAIERSKPPRSRPRRPAYAPTPAKDTSGTASGITDADSMEQTEQLMGRAVQQIKLVRFLLTQDKHSASFEKVVRDFYEKRPRGFKAHEKAERTARQLSERTQKL